MKETDVKKAICRPVIIPFCLLAPHFSYLPQGLHLRGMLETIDTDALLPINGAWR
jgi:hypothetical protein